MKYINVGIGECGVAKDGETELRTYALGSCIAVVIFDPIRKIGGMAHIALPDSSVDPIKSKNHPCYFADTGIPKLLEELSLAGAPTICSNFVVKITGGFNTLNNNIGVRNATKIRAVISSLGLTCYAEDVGGVQPRTVFFTPNQFMLKIHSPDGAKWEI